MRSRNGSTATDFGFGVAARLVRASDGFVVWSETYDRPADDKLMIQDDIAGEVRKALETTIARNAAPVDGKSG